MDRKNGDVARLRNNSITKKELYVLATMVIFVPIAGEIKFYPFNDIYRVSFAPPMLFFFLLRLGNVPAILPGVLVGISVLTFRIFLDVLLLQSVDWQASFYTHYPSFFYYFTYALVFFVLKIHHFYNRPWVIGFLGIAAELAAGMVELFVENIALETAISADAVNKIVIIAIFRSFFVIGLFSTIKLYESKIREADIQKQNEHMILLISNLYEETILLKKSVQHAEEVTKQSYELYQKLQEVNQGKTTSSSTGIPQHALRIAGEVHEIKKDNQRILAGLSKLITEESNRDYLDIHSLLQIIVRTNEKYAALLDRDIQFDYTVTGLHPSYHVYTFISIINNLVANAVEAIKESGMVEIAVLKQQEWIELYIRDNGPGIPDKYKDIIFKAGFTMKFDSIGNSSTGIGLTYVKDMVERLEGEVKITNRENGSGTVFMVRLPIQNLIEKG